MPMSLLFRYARFCRSSVVPGEWFDRPVSVSVHTPPGVEILQRSSLIA